jgi:O-antigen ligase
MHSNPLQIALERGLPALIVWLILLGVYVRMLWRIQNRTGVEDFARGVAIGALGGTIGFLTSGLVHYNWGDSEVVTVFYFIMGLCLVVERTNQRDTDSGVRA